MEGLTPGRIVHVVYSDGEHYPAIITGLYFGDTVHGEAPEGTIFLTMFRPFYSPEPLPVALSYDEKKSQMTWHWIERA